MTQTQSDRYDQTTSLRRMSRRTRFTSAHHVTLWQRAYTTHQLSVSTMHLKLLQVATATASTIKVFVTQPKPWLSINRVSGFTERWELTAEAEVNNETYVKPLDTPDSSESIQTFLTIQHVFRVDIHCISFNTHIYTQTYHLRVLNG